MDHSLVDVQDPPELVIVVLVQLGKMRAHDQTGGWGIFGPS